MTVSLDHIVLGCLDLGAGEAQLSDALGAPPAAHGTHAMMGTHNALWNMGDAYIELVAIDPAAPHPGRPRWFGLDDPKLQATLGGGPRLINWAVSTGDLDPILAAAPVALGPVEPFARDDLKWEVSVPEGGGPGLDGAFPLTIHWLEGLHPAQRLPDVGLRCARLQVRHPEAEAILAALGPVSGPVDIEVGAAGLSCGVTRADGAVATF